VLETGVGAGRLAVKAAPLCRKFTGIDIFPRAIEKTKQHLRTYENTTLICTDYVTYSFTSQYDVIYSSLTWTQGCEERNIGYIDVKQCSVSL